MEWRYEKKYSHKKGRIDILVYGDSPYYAENCSSKDHYKVDLNTEEGQTRYLETIADVPFPMLISGYDNSLYQKILEQKYGWEKKLIAVVPKSMKMTRGAKSRVEEYVWMNYRLKSDGTPVLTT